MKLSEKTIGILKNYATINQSILFTPGKELNTVSVQKNLMSSAEIEEDIPAEFAIYDLNEFLSTVSLFEDPDLEFTDTNVLISSGSSKTRYWFADKEIIVYPTKKIEMPETEVNFTLTADNLSKLVKACGTLGVPDMCIRNDDGKIVAEVLDKRNDTSNTYSIEVGSYDGDADFKFYVLTERLKMIPGDYRVQISSKNISKLTGDGVTYWIALEQDSTYE